MSPRQKHIPDNAQRTSVCLTAEERAAVRWISEVRRGKKDRRTTINDILVDALWYFLEHTEHKTKADIRSTIPVPPLKEPVRSKVAEMPKTKTKQ